MVPNSSFPNNHLNYLNPDELYLFSLLYRWRIPYDHTAVFSIDGINDICDYKFMAIKPNGDATRNKTKIKQIINSLCNKDYIFVENLNKKKNNELLYIGFYDYSHYHEFAKGHNQNITYKLFDQFDNPIEFYIYAYIDCFGSEGRNISFENWENITGLKHDKIETVINKMNSYESKPRIWKFSGDYYKSETGVRQEINTYYTRPDEGTIKRWNGFYGKKNRVEKKDILF